MQQRSASPEAATPWSGPHPVTECRGTTQDRDSGPAGTAPRNQFSYTSPCPPCFRLLLPTNLDPKGSLINISNPTLSQSLLPIKIKLGPFLTPFHPLSTYTGFLHSQNRGDSLVAQWLRICLPMQGTWVRTLVREDPTCCGATKPMRHNYWACALEPASHNYWSPRA